MYTTWSTGAGVFIHPPPTVTVELIYRGVNYLPVLLSLFQKMSLGTEMAQQLDIIPEHPKCRQGTDSVCYCYIHPSFFFFLSLCNILNNNKNTYFISISYPTLNFFIQWTFNDSLFHLTKFNPPPHDFLFFIVYVLLWQSKQNQKGKGNKTKTIHTQKNCKFEMYG